MYIAYLDSVKYFEPAEVNAARGPDVKLRTLAYQELLIGYLADCQRRGFRSAFIWACPPRKVRSLLNAAP